MATKTQTIEVRVDEELEYPPPKGSAKWSATRGGKIAGKAVHGWHATAFSDGKRRVYITFEEVTTVGA